MLFRSKMSFKLKHELEHLPAKIQALTEEITDMEAQLANPAFYMEDPQAFDKIVRELPKRRAALTAAEERWLTLEEMREQTEG